jgi:CheY-like chemotaxis protein
MMKPLILIIEDDTILSEAMAETLGDLGCRVIRTDSSEEGLRLAEKRQPDLILCDVVLPDGAGFDTVKALRANPATAKAAIILMTGHQEESNYDGEGKSLLLLKPFSLDMLVEVVKGTLAARGITVKPVPLAV